MYLSARRYASGFDFNKEPEKKLFRDLIKAAGFSEPPLKDTPSCTLSVTVAYWRKANAIHRWFVETVQDGVDECQAAHVSREQLQALLTDCQTVLGHRENAEDILPTQGGFFFGDTDIGEGYWQDIEETVSQLKSILDNPKFKGWDFEYRASW